MKLPAQELGLILITIYKSLNQSQNCEKLKNAHIHVDGKTLTTVIRPAITTTVFHCVK